MKIYMISFRANSILFLPTTLTTIAYGMLLSGICVAPTLLSLVVPLLCERDFAPLRDDLNYDSDLL